MPDHIQIDEAELVDLALQLGNIDSPPGDELPAAQFVYDWLVANGFRTQKIGMFDERFNVLGTLAGSGAGYSLIFNSHLDTSQHGNDHWSLRNPDAPIFHSAWRDGGVLVGSGVVNDKGPMAAFLMAAKAIKNSDIHLKGDLLLSAVCGEIGTEPVDEFQSPRYLSKEAGARYLIQHGGVADFALVAECTQFKFAAVEAGKAFFKVTVFGDRQYYAPFSPDVDVTPTHPNAIVRAALLVPKIQEWGRRYERENTYESRHGTVIPKVTVGAIRGGNPYHVTRTSELCSVYLDIRTIPGQDPLAIRSAIRELLEEEGIPGEVELFVYRRSYEAENHEVLLEELARSHGEVVGGDLEVAASPYSSMWRDISVFNEMGIPAITYGPGALSKIGPNAEGGLSMRIEDLLTVARVYAALALRICTREKPVPGDSSSNLNHGPR